jgi:predicted MFS family arabinose efflux permease
MMNASERRATMALGSIFALRMLGLFMIVPVFAIYGQSYTGATPALIGVAIGVYGLTQACFQIPMSLWADRFPRKPLIVMGLLIFAVGGLISALSTDIWGVIIGRAVAGGGAVSAVVMALLADVTREEQRSKAMAAMGMSIALSFIVAFSLGPILTQSMGLNGLFALTSVSALLAIGLLFLVPTPVRAIRQTYQSYPAQLQQVLRLGDLNRLHFSIFMLHLLMTAAFVMIPSQLMHIGNIPVSQHGWVYLPLLLLGFVLAVPAIIVAEAKRRMRRIFISAVILITVSLLVLTTVEHFSSGLLLGIGLFFIAFNLLEALLPSWLAKTAPVASKATAMGLNASSQFFGAFVGGVAGGQLVTHMSVTMAWSVLAVLSVFWVGIVFGLTSPPYLSSLAVRLPVDGQLNVQEWAVRLLDVHGIEDAVVLEEHHIAYLKIDRQQFDEDSRQELSLLIGMDVAF